MMGKNTALTSFFAPSDISGAGGMRHELIHSCPVWRGEHPQSNCIFISTNLDLGGMRGMDMVHILTFFSFVLHSEQYLCTVVRWFVHLGEPDEDTGMWIVCPGFNACHQPDISTVHLNTIYHAAHLIPVHGTQEIPQEIQPHHSYDVFHAYYVNRFVDHHAFEIAS